jgi:hypothetical protein
MIPLVLLLLLSKRTRLILLALPFAILPDLDYFYLHRALLHNVFIPVFFLLVSLSIPIGEHLYLRIKKAGSHLKKIASHAKRLFTEKVRYAALFISFYITTHIFFDYFDDGDVLFYPFDRTLYYTRVDLGIEFKQEQIVRVTETGQMIITNITTTTPVTTVAPSTYEYSLVKFREYVQFSNSVEFAVFLLCLAILVIVLYRRKHGKSI